jgi:hypothetical protein
MAWREMRRGRAWTVALAAALLFGLASCASGSGSTVSGPGANGNASAGAPGLAATEQPTPTPTTLTLTTPGAQQGMSEFCAQPPSVSAQLPASVPTYPSAQLRLGQSAGGSGLFGLCSGDSVDAVAQFYASKLSALGWQQVQTNTNGDVQQVSGSLGNAQVFITIEPDPEVIGETEIVILTSGT